MAIRDGFLSELEFEGRTTRRILERVPEAQHSWKPHEKSSTLGNLAMHVASLPMFVTRALTADEYDVHPPGQEPNRTPPFESTAATVATFDERLTAALEVLRNADDPMLLENWSLKFQGKTLFAMPRLAVIRTFAMNHGVHHRGQLSVYLRLLDVPLPSIYGPTADEPM